jgi:hypothetical protein
VIKLVGNVVHEDRDVGCQDGVTKVACSATHGDEDVGCQDGVTKVTCGAVRGDGDIGCQDDSVKLAAEVMGSDRNPSYPILCVMVARSVRDWRGVLMGRKVGREPLPTTEQEGFLPSNSYLLCQPHITGVALFSMKQDVLSRALLERENYFHKEQRARAESKDEIYHFGKASQGCFINFRFRVIKK